MFKLIMLLLFVCCLTLATVLVPQFATWRESQDHGASSAGMLVALMGDSRRLFAHEFFAKADAYFHRGFYPSIFDRKNPGAESDLKEESHQKTGDAKDHEQESTFLGPPKDWIDRLGRHFYPTTHVHLTAGNEREMLPWLKLSAELEPHEIDPYLTASYWLRTSLDKPNEAEQFLRQGLAANPDSPEILLELGRINFYNRTNAQAGRNVFELALQKWRKLDSAGKKPDPIICEEILGEIVRTDRALKDPKQELADLEELIKIARGKGSLQTQIDELKAKLGAK